MKNKSKEVAKKKQNKRLNRLFQSAARYTFLEVELWSQPGVNTKNHHFSRNVNIICGFFQQVGKQGESEVGVMEGWEWTLDYIRNCRLSHLDGVGSSS